MIEEILKLPDISFIDEATLESVQEMMVNDYQYKYREVTKKSYILPRADPMALILYACSVQIFQALLYVDRGGKQNLMKYAYSEFVDHIAALRGIKRNPAKAARTTVRFTLSAARKEPVAIPAGTRVTNGQEIYFATQEYAEIATGETAIELGCICLKSGIAGNDFLPGEINTLTDPIGYVEKVENINVSDGGTDIESDESVIERTYYAPSSYSVAGPDEAYIYWAKTYNTNIADVKITSPEPVEVVVTFIMQGGELPEDSLVEGLENYLRDTKIRPLTDRVTVKKPEIENYSINVKYYINKSDSYKALSIQNEVNAAINDFVIWQSSKIGRDINPSVLVEKMIAAGAKRVEVTQPIFRIIPDVGVAKLQSQNVSYGGIEDD